MPPRAETTGRTVTARFPRIWVRATPSTIHWYMDWAHYRAWVKWRAANAKRKADTHVGSQTS